MSLLKSLTASDSSIKGESDNLGGGAIDSNVYPATINMAYVTVADTGALGLVLGAKLDSGATYRETLWIQSGTAKGGKNYFEKDGVKTFLPGFIVAEAIAKLSLGKSLSELDTEKKVFNIYDSTAQREVPTSVDAVVELLGARIQLGILKQLEDKTVKQGNDYVPTGETRNTNTIDKVFQDGTGLTVPEIQAKETEAIFLPKWVDKNKGQVRNKAKGAKGQPAPGSAAAAAGQTAKPTTSLFGGATS